MGFLSGRITFTRYRVGGDSPLPFGDEILELARQHLIGQHGAAEAADGVTMGWAGGDHVLDLTIDLGKNILNDAAAHGDPDRRRQDPRSAAAGLHPDGDPGPRQGNPSGFATKAQQRGGQGGRQGPRRGRGRRRPVPPP